MMRTDSSSILIVLFKTAGSRLKRLSHKPCEISATLATLGRSFVGRKISAHNGSEAEGRKEILRHHRALQVNRIGLGQIAFVDAAFEGEGGKRLLIVSPFVKKAAEHELLPFERLHQSDRYQPIVMRVRQATKKNPIHDAENGSSRADAQCQRGDHGKCERRTAAKATQGVAHILHQGAQPPAGFLFMALLSGRLDGSELNPRLAPRLFGVHACSEVKLGRLLQVKLQLVLEFGWLAAEEEKADPGKELTHHDDASGICFNTRAMAVESLSQVSSSAFNCLRPAAVSK